MILRIPDEVADRLGAAEPGLEREALEALVLERYRAGRISTDDLRQILGFGSLNEVDGFLKAHGVYHEYTVGEINRQVAALTEIGL